jgi:hypothetical protein
LLDILNGKNKDANDTDDKTSDPNEDKGPLDRLFGG